jgi:hypothetical protein
MLLEKGGVCIMLLEKGSGAVRVEELLRDTSAFELPLLTKPLCY